MSSTPTAVAQVAVVPENNPDALSLSLPKFPAGLDEHPLLRDELEACLNAANIETSGNVSERYNYPRFFVGRSFVELNFIFSEPAKFEPTSDEYLSLKSEAMALGLTILITPLNQQSKFEPKSENFLTLRSNLVGNPFDPEPRFAENQLANLIQFVQNHLKNGTISYSPLTDRS